MRRSGLRHALAWSLERPCRAAFVVALLALAGTASVFGLLRWQHAFLRWSFATICWLPAVCVLIRLALEPRTGK